MKTAAEFAALAKHLAAKADGIHAAPANSWAVDDIASPYGREALYRAAREASRAAYQHSRQLDAFERDKRIREALTDAIDAAAGILADGNLTASAGPAVHLAQVAKRQLAGTQPVARPPRGSRGRPVEKAAAQAAAEIYDKNEEPNRDGDRKRPVPISGKAAESHPLRLLLDAISADLFDRKGLITVSLLRAPKK